MKILHNEAVPTGAAQAEPRPFRDAEIRAGKLMGVSIRSAINPDAAKEFPVPLELGMQIAQLLFDHALEEVQRLNRKLEELESRRNFTAEKGGQAQ